MLWTIAAVLMWIVLIASAGLFRGPRGAFDPGNAVYHAVRWYVWLRHRPTLEGLEHLPGGPIGPLIVVANHASGVDPLLIQAVLPFEPRWVMASDMRHPAGEWLWHFARVIFVDRLNSDPAGVREALRHLGNGGVLGLFPEGGIERRERTLRPFQPGIGLLVRRSGARVLPIVIEGAAMAPTAWGALVRTSRPRVRVMPLVEYDRRVPLSDVTADLQSRYERWTGWGVD